MCLHDMLPTKHCLRGAEEGLGTLVLVETATRMEELRATVKDRERRKRYEEMFS